MATLTDTLTLQLRGEIGDTGENFVISHVELQAMYDRAVGDYDLTLVYALRRMRAYYAKAVTASGQDERKYNNTLYEHYTGLLEEAERNAGLDRGVLSVGSMTLNLNSEDGDDDS